MKLCEMTLQDLVALKEAVGRSWSGARSSRWADAAGGAARE